MNVDEHGLDEMDNRILTTIIDKFKGGPVGLTTIATAVGEQEKLNERTDKVIEMIQSFVISGASNTMTLFNGK